MKKLLLSLVAAIVVATATFAQNSGLGFNYQAVVRNADGLLLSNSNVNLRISLYTGQTATTPTWVETHNVQTDASGSFGITVGHGNRVSSSIASKFSDVNFGAVYYWMKIELQEGTNYREVSFAQLPSAPYSEVAHNASAVPAGMIMAFAGTADNVPEGWLLCDGSAVSRSDYSNLYKAIGVSWGTGDNSTTFNLPDLRGMFLRGVSGDSGNDPDAASRTLLKNNGGNTGNNVGSYQNDAIRNITGKVNPWSSFASVSASGALGSAASSNFPTGASSGYGGKGFDFDASRVVPVGNDNRPKNVYVTYIIKY